MTYFKVVMLIAVTSSLVGEAVNCEKSVRGGYTKTMWCSGILYLLAVCIESVQSYLA